MIPRNCFNIHDRVPYYTKVGRGDRFRFVGRKVGLRQFKNDPIKFYFSMAG